MKTYLVNTKGQIRELGYEEYLSLKGYSFFEVKCKKADKVSNRILKSITRFTEGDPIILKEVGEGELDYIPRNSEDALSLLVGV